MKMEEIRAQLYEIGDRVALTDFDLGIKIHKLADATFRRKSVRRARTKKSRLTPELKERIIRYAALHPEASYLEISIALGVNTGRISEALAGFKT